ncbi:MAG: 2-oxoglutarate dehydrogenase E1 component [Rickettsiales bacterium]|nr:2-oxoglutarate dehydrogenase E1 component [Rickettsiales bacterium]
MSDENAVEEHLFSGNTIFVEEMYRRYLENASLVDQGWQNFFASMGVVSEQRPSWAKDHSAVIGQIDPEELKDKAKKKQAKGNKDAAVTQDSVNALMMIHAYRVRGHLMADLDPLNMEPKEPHPELQPETYGFTEADYDKEIVLNGVLGHEKATLRQIVDILRQTYCAKIGVEFMHIQYPEQKQWLQQHVEGMAGKPKLTSEEQKNILHWLIEVEAFEEFLQMKYPGMKRFSIQGGDATIAGLEVILETASDEGVEEIVIGMPHRGRLNVLTTIMGKPYSEMLSLFHGNLDFPDSVNSSGDVKYHLGASHDRTMPNGKNMHLSLNANPSHLEAVNPVVCGKVRAKQDQKTDTNKDKVMALTLHGDAAFAGQGSVPETLSLSELRGYRTGGTVHVIVNNQIGFTTSPKFSRFTPYPSDVAKMVQAPIFHVNGDDPDSVAYCCRLATQFRQKFKRDVVVDIFCYRQYGHNEGDEPMFTQPKMYKAIAKHDSPAKIYANYLKQLKVVDQNYVDEEYARFNDHFEKSFDAGKNFIPNKANWLEGKWSGIVKPEEGAKPEVDTGVEKKKLEECMKSLCEVPKGFNLNRKIQRQLKAKLDTIKSGEGFDWSMGEALAFSTLLKEGYPVRLSGQDSERGTFSHRHSVWTDQETEEHYTPLNHLSDDQAFYEVINSSLSELAILGFEYGYSLAEPDALVMWEAQFGDFANGAQMIIDQFISSGEIKWLRMSGLVLLLPHGYEGQGPEHSSARLERFLQLCGDDNMQVVNCTTPANFFHALRRQLKRNFRKPLVVMTPKSLLRHKLCTSNFDDFLPGTSFSRVIPEIDKIAADDKVKKLVFTSGKVYYDLLEARREQKIDDVALVRMEQYYPFPAAEVRAAIKKYKNADVCWCQEEPKNMGAWTFVAPYIEDIMEEEGRLQKRLSYAGRPTAASPAAGYLKIHEKEQSTLVEQALKTDSASSKTKRKKAS